MKLRNIIKSILLGVSALALVVLSSCTETSTSHSVNVKTFTFKTSDLAPDLYTTEFTIDTINYLIYNVDSVAFTSVLTKVVPVVTCYTTPSEIRINDTYWNQVDSIDVTSPFKLTIVGTDKKTTRDFTVTVNKHKVDSRTIGWTQLDVTGISDQISDARAVFNNGKFYLFADIESGGQKVYSSPDAASWTQMVSLPESPLNILSLYAVDGAYAPDSVFVLGADGSALFVLSESMGLLSQVCTMPDGAKAENIIGEVKENIIISVLKDGSRKLYYYDGVELDTDETADLPASFPTAGAAKCNVYIDAPTIVDAASSYLIGGKTSSAERLQTAYASDNGWHWINVVKDVIYGFPAITKAAAVWYDKRLFIIGGDTAAGTALPQYVSTDTGYTWAESADCFKLPSTCELSYGISVVRDDADDYVYVIGGYTSGGQYKLQCFRGRAIHKDFLIK